MYWLLLIQMIYQFLVGINSLDIGAGAVFGRYNLSLLSFLSLYPFSAFLNIFVRSLWLLVHIAMNGKPRHATAAESHSWWNYIPTHCFSNRLQTNRQNGAVGYGRGHDETYIFRFVGGHEEDVDPQRTIIPNNQPETNAGRETRNSV